MNAHTITHSCPVNAPGFVEKKKEEMKNYDQKYREATVSTDSTGCSCSPGITLKPFGPIRPHSCLNKNHNSLPGALHGVNWEQVMI